MKEAFLKNAQAAFLLETVEFYNSGNRCFGNTGCQYRATENSPGCAIGRHQPNDALRAQWDFGFDGTPGLSAWDKPQLIDLGPLAVLDGEFLMRVQDLHDTQDNWDMSGLTGTGLFVAMSICDQFGLDKNLVFPTGGVTNR